MKTLVITSPIKIAVLVFFTIRKNKRQQQQQERKEKRKEKINTQIGRLLNKQGKEN